MVEKALKENETLLRATLEATADGILVVDDCGKVICRNTRFGEMWNIPARILDSNNDENLINSVLSQLKNSQMFVSKVQELYRSNRNEFDSLEFKDGKIFERYSEPLIVNGNVVGRVWSFRDITARKKAEREKATLHKKLQEAEKMKGVGTLAGGVAHDLNNILSGVVSYPELILLDLPSDSPLRGSIETIYESGKKAAAIVQDLLTLTRRGVSINDIINLNDIISEYLKSPEFAKLKSFHPLISIETCLAKEPLNLVGSSIHLSKTIMNLVSNAAEAITGEGSITIDTAIRYIDKPVYGYDKVNEGDYIVVTVSDNGVGIASEEISRIFEPFYTKKVMGRSGTGLGMAVVWGTVQDHNGYIHVESELGKGTTFNLYLPATSEKKSIETKPNSLADLIGKGEKILVVDDVKEQRDIASRILTKLGYTVKLATSGEEAINFIKSEEAELMVIDMIMPPGKDGLETYEEIISIRPNQKAIIVSGYSETNRVKKIQELGAGSYIKKPYSIESIGIAVKSELERVKEAA
jgi:PAS domain S-box-containing protein